jgi:hypothetical protein
MKIIIISIFVVLAIWFVVSCTKKSDDHGKIIGSLKDIENKINLLMNGNNEQSFLVIEISGTGDFIQFTGDKKGVQLDFPLLTENQKRMESKIRSIAKDQSLTVVENKGTDGNKFLDIDLNGTPAAVSKKIKSFLEKLFDVNDNTKLKFELNA